MCLIHKYNTLSAKGYTRTLLTEQKKGAKHNEITHLIARQIADRNEANKW